MTSGIEDLPVCTSCGGSTSPLILCETCGAASVLHNLRQIEWALACPECGTFNSWQLICDQCRSRFPAPGGAKGPKKDAPTPPPSPAPVPTLSPNERRKRRLRGEYDSKSVEEMLRVLGVDEARAYALIDRGYNTIWKIARASEADLARIPEVGPVSARKIVASLHLLNYQPPQRTKEEIEREEYECPLCRCIAPAFSSACLECGAAFDEEEMDESIRKEFDPGGPNARLAFYDRKVQEVPGNAEFWYARALALESLDRADEAIASLNEAAARAPDSKKVKVAHLRLQAKRAHVPQGAQKLRSAARALVDDAAWEQEIAELDQFLSKEGAACPRCGAHVPQDATTCPSCGTPWGAIEAPAVEAPETSAESAELDVLVDDLLVGELEASLTPEELERTKAAVLDWLILELEDSMGADALRDLPKKKPAGKELSSAKPPEPSPVIGSVGFLSGWMRGSKGLVTAGGPRRKPKARPGRVNGLVNGSGRVNGLVNGVGRVNGLVNGVGRVNGLVNGTLRGEGRVNGLVSSQGRVNGATVARGVRLNVRGQGWNRSPRVRYALIAVGIAFALIIGTTLFVPAPGTVSPITIDGIFADWSAVPALDAASPSADPNVSISRYATLLNRDDLYLYASSQGSTFGDTTGYDGFYFLIDADGDPATGFAFDDLGADAVVDVFGGNSTVHGARLYAFPSDAELNWSRRQASGRVDAAASAGGLEARISTFDVARFDPDSYRIGVYATNFEGSSSRSAAPLNPLGGAILLEQRPLAGVVGAGPTDLLEVRVRALGITGSDSWAVSSFALNATPGTTVAPSADTVTLSPTQPTVTITVSVSAAGFSPGDMVEVEVVGAQAPRPLVVRGEPARAYVMSPPSEVRIDGLFADWIFIDVLDTDGIPPENPDVDIRRAGAAVNASTSFFHVAVAGTLLDGTVPQRHIRVPPSAGGNGSAGGPPIPLPRQTGEDILRVYIDVNASDSQGDPVGGIWADLLLEVRGHGGRITSQALFAWTTRWVAVPDPEVLLAKNATDIEGSLPLSGMGPTRMVFAATDWSGLGDTTAPVNATVLAPNQAPELSNDLQINAPEFHEVAAPVAGTLLVVLLFLRRRRRDD